MMSGVRIFSLQWQALRIDPVGCIQNTIAHFTYHVRTVILKCHSYRLRLLLLLGGNRSIHGLFRFEINNNGKNVQPSLNIKFLDKNSYIYL